MANPFWSIAEAKEIDAKLAELFSFKETKVHPTYGPYGYSGASRIDKTTHDALMMAHYLANKPLVITQGGLNNNAVVPSAATHNGLGVADTSRNGMSTNDVFELVSFGMDCGLHGMIRGVSGIDKMVAHIHWVRIGAKRVMHPSTYQQIYNARYGTAHGGGGLGGSPGTRWYGPKLKKLLTWSDSQYNPKNGWRPKV